MVVDIIGTIQLPGGGWLKCHRKPRSGLLSIFAIPIKKTHIIFEWDTNPCKFIFSTIVPNRGIYTALQQLLNFIVYADSSKVWLFMKGLGDIEW